jgi:hypothetical protein
MQRGDGGKITLKYNPPAAENIFLRSFLVSLSKKIRATQEIANVRAG